MKWGIHFDLANKQLRVEEIEGIMEEPGFWDSAEKSQAYVKELKNLKDVIAQYTDLKQRYEDIYMLIDLANEENDTSMVPEIQKEAAAFVEEFEELRLDTLLSDEYDKDNAILTLHAGAGGTESCDWASMLSRMYQKWADHKGYTTETFTNSFHLPLRIARCGLLS